MGLCLKSALFFFWGWVALSQGTKAPGPCVNIAVCTVLQVAKQSMTESNILDELAAAATKNQGSHKAIKGIKGLKVKDIQPPIVHLGYVLNSGMCISVVSQITIAGKSFIGGTMEITVRSNMTTQSRMITEKGKLVLEVIDCRVALLSCKTNLPSSMLPKIVNKFLNSTLGKVLPGMMCPAADKVVGAMKKNMDSMWEAQKCGNHGSVQYSINSRPIITSSHARVCFQTQIKRADGEELDLPTEPPVLDDSDMSELGKDQSYFTIPPSFLNNFMELYKKALDQDVSSNTMDGGPMLNRNAMKEKVPSMEIPATYNNMMSKIRSAATPTWTLAQGSAALYIPLVIEIVALPQHKTLYVLDVILKISVTFQITDGKLFPSLGESSLENLQMKSSEVGSFDPEPLKSDFRDILAVTSIPALREAMKDGIPLPSMMGSTYGEATIEIHPNGVLAIVGCDSE